MLYLCSTTLFTFGIVLVLLGATQAELAHDLSLDLTASGFLGAVLSLGLGVGVLGAGPLADRLPRGPLFVGACSITALGLLAIDSGRSYAVIVALVSIVGVGCGAYDTIINAAIVDRYRERTSSALALAHSAATVGACIGPLFVQFLRSRGSWSDAFHALGYAYLGLAVWGGLAGLGRTREKSTTTTRAPMPLLSTTPALALGIACFAYVGAENGLTLFAVPWAQSRAESESAGQWSISTFWFGLLLGRLALAARPPRRGSQLLAACGIAGASVVCVASALVIGPLSAATILAGMSLGPTYPLLMTLTAARFPSAPATALGLVGGAGAAGGFAVPWIVGAIGDALGMPMAIAALGLQALLISAAGLALARHEARVSFTRSSRSADGGDA